MGSETEQAKRELRKRITSARKGLRDSERAAMSGRLIAELLVAPEIAAADVLACYMPVGTEPDVAEFVTIKHVESRTVLLPVLLEDDDLDWAEYDGEFHTGRRGLTEPDRRGLGVDAIARADAVIVPGLAVDRSGARLGRGGGSYDRALARLSERTWTVTPLYTGEVLDEVPAEPHDMRVHAAVTPEGVHRLGATGATGGGT